jgi:hypothetical protein
LPAAISARLLWCAARSHVASWSDGAATAGAVARTTRWPSPRAELDVGAGDRLVVVVGVGRRDTVVGREFLHLLQLQCLGSENRRYDNSKE